MQRWKEFTSKLLSPLLLCLVVVAIEFMKSWSVMFVELKVVARFRELHIEYPIFHIFNYVQFGKCARFFHGCK
jgi:hypothetical protein